MKNNNERILKYLSGLMDGDEKIFFEKELTNSMELKSEYDIVNQKLREMLEVKSTDVNEKYFINLTAIVKQRLDTKHQRSWFAKLYYAIPVLAAILVTLILLPKEEINFNDYTSQLANEIVDNLDNEQVADRAFTEVYNASEIITSTGDGNIFSISLPEDVTISNDKLFNEIDIASYDYSVLDEISEEELNSIYKKLLE